MMGHSSREVLPRYDRRDEAEEQLVLSHITLPIQISFERKLA